MKNKTKIQIILELLETLTVSYMNPCLFTCGFDVFSDKLSCPESLEFKLKLMACFQLEYPDVFFPAQNDLSNPGVAKAIMSRSINPAVLTAAWPRRVAAQA